MSGLGGYCHSEFWNTSLTWDADVPDFTPCFERTVLVWVPCGFLWLFSPVETLMVLRSNDRFIPWTVLNICKYGVSVSGGSVRFGSDNPVASVDTAAVVQREAPPEREVCRAVDTAAVVQCEVPPEREVCRAVDTAAVVQREAPPEREVCRAVDTAAVVQREVPPEREVCRAIDTAAVVQREVPPEREVCRAVDTEPELRIDETDFTAVFDDVWTVRWLRPAAAWMKRTANRLSPDWDTPIVSEELQREVDEVSRRFRACDPARGQWCVTGTSVVVWTDASSIARGVVLTDPDTGAIIEDASWLRAESERDVHINISELDAALNGVNLAVAWGFRRLTLRTDSVTVHRWLSDALSGKARLRTKAQSEMLIRRRVAVFRQLVIEYELEVTIELVASAVNRADEVTRVPNAWLQTADQPTTDSSKAQPVAVAAITSASASDIRTIHENIGHQGVRRTLWYARRELGVRRVSKPAVRDVVRRCQTCASIDPAPERWPGGSLGTERTWDRLAMDVTHVHGHPYLTLVDCGPSRYAIWRRLRRAGALEIVSELENVFLERGAPAEILTDNATEFRGRVMLAFAARWDVSIRFRAACEPGGNGIVERHHRTIKVMVARQSCSVAEAVHRYNVTPKDGSDPATAPINGVLRHPGRDVDVTPRRTSDEPGDALPLKKPGVYQLFASVLLILQLGGLIYAVTQHSSDPDSIRSVDIYTPVILFVSIALALVFMLFEKRRGIRTSGVIWVFWTLLAFCGIAEFRTRIMNATGDERVDQDTTPFVLYMIYFPVLFAEWLLNCFADAPAQYVEDEIKGDKPSPKASSSFISNITFAWFEPMAFRGWRRSLQRDDLWDLNPADRCSKIVPVFNSHWYKLLEKSRSRAPPRVQKVEFTKTTDDVAFSGQKRAYKRASILPALIKTFGGSFLLGVLLKFINDTLQFINPQILSKIISFVSDPSQPSWHGYFYAVLMVCVNMLMSGCAQPRFMDLASYICLLWSAPYQIILAVYFLYRSSVRGPLRVRRPGCDDPADACQRLHRQRHQKLQLQQMKYKDQRVKLMNEILSGIKVRSAEAVRVWRPSFEEQVLGIRQQEIRVLRKTAYLNAGTSFIWTCAPFVVTLITFAVYVLTGDDVDPHYLTPDKAFVCLASFATYVLVDSDNVLDSRRAFVALALFNALALPPLHAAHDHHQRRAGDPVVVENGTFTWDPESTPYLQDINMRVKEGSLVAVVGTVGSGKSSLLSALLGEMEKVGGRVNTKGNVAYVAQEAWIQNATLKDNILFGRTLDEDLYNRCVDACALRSDFDMLPGGDKTEIGEKGINLSGGQKQRVALARAVYSNSDIYFLDDPLSAVDSHVGKHIFENVIGPEGMLSKKVSLLW
ncbi:Canalicular multispecific organic anion transporter 2 [Amphibalanus amphitrite]|uniref:Canalicular multispecific organic anion transporter 2 n=1 Tax=Amphibalanus amphitrite TaxID=1232801 RepID=A0A6A4WLH1_AMPAM|nr:Canalicular multispecific organic anion transporter 2 [Amphibalanus amphitrite]